MIEVRFHDQRPDLPFKYAVIIARSQGKWVFCRHRARTTYEFPGGHWEPGEKILDTARRELHEETGAIAYTLRPVCAYSVLERASAAAPWTEAFGMLYYAEISAFSGELQSEIAQVVLLEQLPANWTYPHIQPLLMEKALTTVDTELLALAQAQLAAACPG